MEGEFKHTLEVGVPGVGLEVHIKIPFFIENGKVTTKMAVVDVAKHKTPEDSLQAAINLIHAKQSSIYSEEKIKKLILEKHG